MSLLSSRYISAMYFAYKNAPIPLPKMSSTNDRMIFTLQCHALTVVVLVHMFLVRVRVDEKHQ